MSTMHKKKEMHVFWDVTLYCWIKFPHRLLGHCAIKTSEHTNSLT